MSEQTPVPDDVPNHVPDDVPTDVRDDVPGPAGEQVTERISVPDDVPAAPDAPAGTAPVSGWGTQADPAAVGVREWPGVRVRTVVLGLLLVATALCSAGPVWVDADVDAAGAAAGALAVLGLITLLGALTAGRRQHR